MLLCVIALSAIGMLKDSDEYKAASEDRQRELVGGITGFIDEILVPSEKVVEIRNSKKKMKEKMLKLLIILTN